jgi:hypothetical protein
MSPTQIIDSYLNAWRDRDPERIARHFAPHGVRSFEVVVPPLLDETGRRVGPAQIAIPVRGLLTAIPDLTLEVLNRADAGPNSQVEMVEWRHTGTHTGDWDRLTGQGEPVEFSGVSVIRVGENEILEERLYFDPYLLTRNWVPSLPMLGRMGMTMWKQGRATKRARRSG